MTMTMMKTLSKIRAEKGIWMKEKPVPEAGVNDVLIKIGKTAICGTDIHIYNWDDWSQKTIPPGMTVGHEFAGVVVEAGREVTGFKPGDRVSGEGHLVCGDCRNCRAGRRHLCRHTKGVGVNRPGSFAEYLSIPAANVFPLPDSISDEQAAIFDPFGNAVHATLQCTLVGEDVLVTGAGPIGIMAAVVARHAGARHVVITDVNSYRLDLARTLGVSHTIHARNDSLKECMQELGMTEGFDVGLEMSGNGAAFTQMIDHMNHGGHVSLLGIPARDTTIDWNQVIFKMLTIQGIYGREIFETWYKMGSFLQSGLNIDPIITHRFPVEEYQQAFEIMASGQSGKVILDWTAA